MGTRTKPETVWTCIETFLCRDGVIAAGTKMRQPIGPELYWVADADDADVAAARHALSLERPAPQHYPPPAPPKPRVRCTRTFFDLGERISEGDEFDFDMPIVESVPENFEPA
jgi:hypothetical protein